jgi:pyridoxal phosphate enzyme (YggS family)
MISVEKNLAQVKHLITQFEQRYGRPSGSVRLLAASKGQSIEKILAAFQAGQRCFGENYVQEALVKMATLPDASIEWHFIGPLQSNKTRKVAEHFAWVHSVDSKKIAKRLNEQRPATLTPLNICIEVNISGESTKSGIPLEDVTSLAAYCLTLPQLHLRGLMTIPAVHKNLSAQRQAFHQLFLLAESLRTQGFALDTLSMGMSEDMEAAIAEGSTFIRIGTAIFGPRG